MQLLAPLRVEVKPPHLYFSDLLPPELDWSPLIANVSAAYEAPAVTFEGPQDLLVNGRAFNVIAANQGLVSDSIHLTDRFALKDFFEGVTQTTTMEDAGKGMLVACNIFSHNYYHWTMQSLAAILLYRLGIKPSGGAIATAGLLPMMRETLSLHGIDMDVMQLNPNQMAIISGGFHTNLMGSDLIHAPHPQVIRLLREPLGRIVPSRTFGRRLYIGRKDSNNRRMMKEDVVEKRLLERGFETITLSQLSVADQMAAFRDADIIVAPHGAGLTNLIYCDVARAPAKVIELAQNGFVSMCFVRIGQMLGLDYSFIVNATDADSIVASQGRSYETTWHTDLALLDRVLDENGL